MKTDFNKLKVLIIGPAYPLRGGLATFDELLCRAFLTDGHQTEIISYSLQYPSFLFPGSSQYEVNGKPPEGITIHTILNSINPLNWFRVAKFIRGFKPDLIVVRFWIPFMGPSLGTVLRHSKKCGAKIIAICDNVIPHEKRVDRKSTRLNSSH